MISETLKAQALKNVCACYYYDLANSIDEASEQDLKDMIADPFYCHVINEDTPEDMEDCPEYRTTQAETIRDSLREDGINA